MLLIARPKGRGTYILRDHFRLSECWIGPRTDTTFVFGAPHCRSRHFQYKTAMDSGHWHSAIGDALTKAKNMAAVHEVLIYPFVTNSIKKASGLVSQSTMTPVEVGECDTTHDVIRILLQILHVTGSPDEFALFELTRYGVTRCEPWECPAGMVQTGAAIDLHDSTCQFVLRNHDAVALQGRMLPPNLQALINLDSSSPAKKGSPSRFMPAAASGVSAWGKRLKAGAKNLVARAKRSSAENSKAKDVSYNSPGSAKDAPLGCLYRRPLEDLITDGELPQPVQDMLVRLYQDGPAATGLFRKSANAKLIRQVRERLDAGHEVDMNDVPILAVGAIFKEFLRSMPESVFPGSLYHDFVKTNSVASAAERQQMVKGLLKALPPSNMQLLDALMPVLIRICENEAENNMTARNVGICIGQSLMCPPTTEDVLKNDVPPFMEFLVENSEAIFGSLAVLPACLEAVARAAEDDIDGTVNEGYLEIVATTPDMFADDGDETSQGATGTTERSITFESP